MTPFPNSSDAAVIEAFAGIPGLLKQEPASVACGRALDWEYGLSCTPGDTKRTAAAIDGASITILEQLGHFPMSENPGQFRRYIAPVLGEILKHSTTSTKQGAHV